MFRNALNKFRELYDLKCMKNFAESCELDSKYFWNYVNRPKRIKSCVNPVKLENGEIISNEVDVCKPWKDYFHKLYSPKDSAYFDNAFKSL